MATAERNTTGWFTVPQVAEAMQLSEQEFLQAWLDGPEDELVYQSEPVIHWFSLVSWVEKYYYETSEVGSENPMVKYYTERGRDAQQTIESQKRDEASAHARQLLEELLGLDDWSNGATNRVATKWNLETGDYEVESWD